ncbi:MAG: hypothetical protein ACRDNK_04305 [Solirubrobacteraceae bacterium]
MDAPGCCMFCGRLGCTGSCNPPPPAVMDDAQCYEWLKNASCSDLLCFAAYLKGRKPELFFETVAVVRHTEKAINA